MDRHQQQRQRNKEVIVYGLLLSWALSSFIITTHIVPHTAYYDDYRAATIRDFHHRRDVTVGESVGVFADDDDDNDSNHHHANANTDYIPSYLEQYVIDHAHELGFHETTSVTENSRPISCELIRNESFTDIYQEIHIYIQELRVYNQFMKDLTPMPDIRKQLLRGKTHDMICPLLRPPSDVVFANSTKKMYYNQTRSLLSYSSNNGYLEPLLPPLRHLELCTVPSSLMRPSLLRLDYMVHDFYTMCQKIKKHSRIVLVDMGASLMFHAKTSPATYLTSLYNKFGFYFDHIYAYEITQQDPNQVFEKLPETFLSSYHWINIGVTADPNSRLNPLNILLRNFDQDDLIIVKLDIDTPHVEMPLVYQLLNDPDVANLVDHFYFEHHVHLQELKSKWLRKVNGSVLDSLQLFQRLRQKGVAAHYWP